MVRQSALDRFLEVGPYHECPGEYIVLDAFVVAFYAWLPKSGRSDTPTDWPKDRIRRSLPLSLPCGPGPQNKPIIGNLSAEFTRPRRFVRREDGAIRLEKAA